MVEELPSVFLVGPMGAGKTTIGKLLAKQLGRTFVDSDWYVESQTGADIAWIFAKEGEASFRQIESETLEELLQEGDDVIISTGGGVVVTECNRKLLKKNRKHNVWLHSSFDVVYNRIKKDIPKTISNGLSMKILEKSLIEGE